jgi:predicted  nucleic acid-binding Zn-ribbon protein
MEARRCSECGAVFKERPAEDEGTRTCPLCGVVLRRRERVTLEPDDYQERIRALKEELRTLRAG